jgi:hypothetical protein
VTDDPRQIPTLPVLVELELTTGRTLRGTLFLSITSALRAGPETLEEFLNAERHMVPVRDDAREASDLVARDAVVLVRLVSDIAPREEDMVATDVDLVEIELSNGKTIDGAVEHAQGGRLSDFFNVAQDFFAIEGGGGTVYVNKRHVVAIHV